MGGTLQLKEHRDVYEGYVTMPYSDKVVQKIAYISAYIIITNLRYNSFVWGRGLRLFLLDFPTPSIRLTLSVRRKKKRTLPKPISVCESTPFPSFFKYFWVESRPCHLLSCATFSLNDVICSKAEVRRGSESMCARRCKRSMRLFCGVSEEDGQVCLFLNN